MPNEHTACSRGERGPRWREYVDAGHGGNVELKALLQGGGLAYRLAHFRFALLEIHSARMADETVRDREEHWKEGPAVERNARIEPELRVPRRGAGS